MKVVGALLAGQYRSHRGHVHPGRLLLIDGVATSEGGVVKTGGIRMGCGLEEGRIESSIEGGKDGV